MRRLLLLAFLLAASIVVIAAAVLAVPSQLDIPQRIAVGFLGALGGMAALDQLSGLRLSSLWVAVSESITSPFYKGLGGSRTAAFDPGLLCRALLGELNSLGATLISRRSCPPRSEPLSRILVSKFVESDLMYIP